QPVGGPAVDLPAGDQGGQRSALLAGLVQHAGLLGAAGQPVELGDELADRPVASPVGVVGDVGGQEPAEALRVVPVGAGRVTGQPLGPTRLDGRGVAPLAVPGDGQVHVRVEEGEVVGDL